MSSTLAFPRPAFSEAEHAGDPYLEMDLLRLSTAGSVDDGKSTLIGRLLHDTKSIFEDQLESIERTSRARGEQQINLALLTDGLRAEREQNITIDVAYRYFATPRRKFIIADTPGHVQYTRNMVTGASTAELAIVLVDARKGVLTQSKRHGFIASLLRIPHILVAVNKMDLVGYEQEAYERIVGEYVDFARNLELQDLTFIPISALRGDNVVEESERMPWYHGGTLLHHLETVNVGATRNLADFRFPVQYVIRPHQDFRGFAGRIASGRVETGDEVVALPTGHASRIRSIETADGPLEEASAGESVILTLEDEIDISRGDMLVRSRNLPAVGNRIEATVCWMNEAPLRPGASYTLMHTTRQTQAIVAPVLDRLDVDTLHREPAETLELNDIGRIRFTTSHPIFHDPYDRNRETGSFILIDPHTNATVAAGMIRGEVREAPKPVEHTPGPRPVSPNVAWDGPAVSRAEHESRNGHRAAVLWFTGLSGSGKSTIARALERELFERGVRTVLLDGDRLRHGLCGDLGFSEEDRRENIRRVSEVARLFYDSGWVVLCTFVSPYAADRDRARDLVGDGPFYEIHVDADVQTCRGRDPKGLYEKAFAGEIRGLTGVDAPYEAPIAPELRLDTRHQPVEPLVGELLARLQNDGIFTSTGKS